MLDTCAYSSKARPTLQEIPVFSLRAGALLVHPHVDAPAEFDQKVALHHVGKSMRPSWRQLVFLLFLALGLALATTVDLPSLDQLRHWADHLGPWSVVLFSLLYIVVTQFPFPRTALTVSSGILFGPLLGLAVALFSTTLAAVLAITAWRAILGVGLHDAHDSFFARWAHNQSQHPAMARIDQRLRSRGWFSILCLRLLPGLPFSVLNYACIFAPVRRRDFTIGTLIGSTPSTMIGVLLGDSLAHGDGRSALMLLGGLGIVGVFGLTADLLLPVKSKG